MAAPHSSFSRFRFARASAAGRAPALAVLAVPLDAGILEVSREDGLELLDWLGLGRPEFGAIAARELAPRCRRRLWNHGKKLAAHIERNAHTSLRARTSELLAIAEAAGEGLVMFG